VRLSDYHAYDFLQFGHQENGGNWRPELEEKEILKGTD
jgi:hypothetical protein